MSRPLLFTSFFPLGYHNVEAERKAEALQRFGYDVLYVTAPLIRNPRPTELRRIARHALRKLRRRPSRGPSGSRLRSTSLLFLPPRQLEPVVRLNAAWAERQLVHALPSLREGAAAWVRWPTPEIVAALPRLRPAVVVYECVDSYWETPGVRGRWREVYDSAERRLCELADVVVATNETIAARLEGYGTPVELLPHGVDLFPPRPAPANERPVLGFVGSLDYRIDTAVVRALAQAHPEWRLRFLGPVQQGFDPAAYADLPNVTVEPPVPYARLAEVLAGFDVGLMPYFDHPVYRHMSPVKNLELLAAGRPAVARPSPALEPFRELLYLAETPAGFVAAVERALAEDGPELVARRRSAAAEHGWERRYARMRELLEGPRARAR